MVCRESRLSSAYTTFARDMSGLEDNQCLGLNHDLMQEGANTPAPSRAEWNRFIDQTVNRYRAGQLRISGRSRNPEARLLAARDEVPDGPRYYAAQRIVQRAETAAAAQTNYFRQYAQNAGVPATHVSVEFWTAFNEATDNARLQPSPAFVRAFQANPDHAGLMVDRRSMYAYEQMEIGAASRALQQETVPAITAREVITDSDAISEIGYNEETGRLEIVLHSNPDHAYAYYMGRGDYEDFRNSDSLGRYYAREIRSNSAFRFANDEAEMESRVVRRCNTCGRWSGSMHYCPITGSEEDLNRDIRLAVERARSRAAGDAAPTAVIAPTRLPLTRTQNYPGTSEQGNLRFPTANRVMQEARRHSLVQVPVRSVFNSGNHVVQGLVTVEYNGRGAGYTATAVTTPGDSGVDNLRCSCSEYRANYRCQHTELTVGRVHGIINGQEAATPAQVRAANDTVTAALTTEFEASVAANEAANAGYRPMAQSFEENPELFQEMYEEARAERAAYKDAIAEGMTDAEYPIPYARDTAFGGLYSRESGQGFGVELEFSFPPGTTEDQRDAAIAAIGAELYDLGLTTTRHQLGYGASHGDVRTEHERGWSFENDPSTGYHPRYSTQDGEEILGGEIVSPVMHDEPATWQNLEKVCEVVRKHGGIASRKAGAHVHVGAGTYDHQVENHNRLLAALAENEDLLYRMSTNPERGKHRGRGYCYPNSIPTSPYRDVGRVANAQYGHELALNLQSVSGSRNDHVEFRTFDSSLEPAVIQAQIGMAVYMTEGATRPGTATLIGGERHPLGERVQANPDRSNLTGEAWNESTRGLRRFLDKFVPGTGGDEKDNPRARQLVALFAMTRWQRVNG